MFNLKNMKYTIYTLLGVFLLSFTACNTTRFVKPLDKKEVAVGFDLGGPIVDLFGAKIPLPFTSVSVGYGIDSTFTAFTGLHTTAAAFGTIQLDLGGTKEILAPKKGWIPGFSVSPVVNVMADVFQGNFRVYPQVDVNLYWQYWKNKEHYFYVNCANWFDLYPKAYKGLPETMWNPVVGLGHTFENKKMRYTIEAKYMGFGEPSGGTPLIYNGIGGEGSFGLYFSLCRKF